MVLEARVKLDQRPINPNVNDILLRHLALTSCTDVAPRRLDARLLLRGGCPCGAGIETPRFNDDGGDGDGGETCRPLADCGGNCLDGFCVFGAGGADAVVLVERLPCHSEAVAVVSSADAQEAGVDAPLRPQGASAVNLRCRVDVVLGR